MNDTVSDEGLAIELKVGAILVTFVALGLLGKIFLNLRPKDFTSWDKRLDDMINGYELTLPPETLEYKKLKASGKGDKKALCALLFRRAISLIPLANRLQGDAYGMNRLKRSDILRDAAFNSFSVAEEMIEREIKEVQAEAQALRPDISWGQSIFPQAAQLFQQMKQKEAQKAKEAQEAANKANMEKNKKDLEALEAKKREDALRDLLKDEDKKVK